MTLQELEYKKAELWQSADGKRIIWRGEELKIKVTSFTQKYPYPLKKTIVELLPLNPDVDYLYDVYSLSPEACAEVMELAGLTDDFLRITDEYLAQQ